jgi:hypothetical protein
MKIPDHFSESLETIFGVKILKFFDADAAPYPGSGSLFDPGSGIRDGKKFGSGINIPDLQHYIFYTLYYYTITITSTILSVSEITVPKA